MSNVCMTQEVLCGDGFDNDGDGVMDANDPDRAIRNAGTLEGWSLVLCSL